MENLRQTKTSAISCSIYPNTFNNVENNHFRPGLNWKGLHRKPHLTVNVLGEMSCEAVITLFEVLAPSLITFLTFNLRGTLTSKVANSIAKKKNAL